MNFSRASDLNPVDAGIDAEAGAGTRVRVTELTDQGPGAARRFEVKLAVQALTRRAVAAGDVNDG